MSEIIAFDFAEWQRRMGLNNKQAAKALDITPGFFSRMRTEGKARKLYAWAAYGLERAKQSEGGAP